MEPRLYCYITCLVKDGDNTDIFLNQLIELYSSNATNLHHITSHSTRCVAPQHRDRIVNTDYCDVTSSYVF